MRDRLLGLGQAARDHLAHVVERDLVVGGRGGGAAGAGAGCRRLRGRRRRASASGRRAAGRAPPLSAASMSALTIRPCGPLPFRLCEIEPGLRRHPARQRARRDPLAADRRLAWPPSPRRPAPLRLLGQPWPRGAALASPLAFGAGAADAPSSALLSSPSSSRSAIGSLTFTPSVPLGHQDLAKRALVDRLDLHGGLVGLDLGDDVAGLDRVALVLQPLGEVALGHGRRQGRHQDLDRHGLAPA